MPNKLSTDPELLTVSEAAKLLNVSERSIRRLLASGELGSYKIRRTIRISRPDIDAYLDLCRSGSRRVGFGE